MNYTKQPYLYKRSNPPSDPASQAKYYQDELKKMEDVIAVMYQCLMDLKAKVP
jgi:hypothetical protein